MFPWLETAPPDRLRDVRDTSLAKLVREALMDRILQGELPPGARVSEPEVCERLGISRVPVREALRELESSGLVVSRKHAGVFVREIDAAEVRDLYELRGLYDGFAGARAAALQAPERKTLVQALDESIARMKTAEQQGVVRDYYAENLRFHWLIVEASGNAQLAAAYRGVVQKLHLARLKNLSQGLGMRTSIQEHEAIARAIAQGDIGPAGQLLGQHVGDAYERLTQAR